MTRRLEAVRAAAAEHTWAEIREALGVSKQAAHRKFVKEWANEQQDHRQRFRQQVLAVVTGRAGEGAPNR